jgi:putative addiction module component (TIGR02574 family)
MALTREQIVAEAMALPPEERSRVAEELWLSVDAATQEEIDTAWLTEIRRRIAAVDSGQMKTLPADQVFAELRAKHGGR